MQCTKYVFYKNKLKKNNVFSFMFKKSSSTSVPNVLSHTEASICVLIFMGKGETTH